MSKYHVTFEGRLDGSIGILDTINATIDVKEPPALLGDENDKYKWINAIHKAMCEQLINEDGSRKYEVLVLWHAVSVDTNMEIIITKARKGLQSEENQTKRNTLRL